MITIRKERGVIIVNANTAPTANEQAVIDTLYSVGDTYLTVENVDVPLHHYCKTIGLAKRNNDVIEIAGLIELNDKLNSKLEWFHNSTAEEMVC